MDTSGSAIIFFFANSHTLCCSLTGSKAEGRRGLGGMGGERGKDRHPECAVTRVVTAMQHHGNSIIV